MKKRLIALLCTLAIALGVCAVAAVDVTAATDTFQVGFSRVDINPWVDPADHSKGLLQLPMRGLGNTIHRLNCSDFIDDNGNGVIDEEDGLFATCLAVTDDDGDTVLMISAAIIGGFDMMVDDARPAIVAALKEKGVDIPEENIQIQGTHTHSSIDLTQYKSSYKDSTTEISWLFNQDGDKVTNDAGVTYGHIYANFEVWFPYLIDQLTASAVEAVADQAPATMSKGEIDAGEASGKVMNTVRHYTREATETGETYVTGANFNGSGITYDTTTTPNDTDNDYPGTHELAEANDTMYCLSFNFTDSSKDPIALVNWRAHTTQNGVNGTRLNVSSDYVNCMSRVLSDAGYRSIFIQGAAGNVNPVSKLYGSWANVHKDADGDGIWEGSEIKGNLYGEALGAVAVKCLKNNMSQVTTGDIKVTYMNFHADAKSYTEQIQYDAAVAAALCYDQGWSDNKPFVYPNDLYGNYVNQWSIGSMTFGGDELISFLSEEQQATAAAYQAAGQTYAIASTYHAADIKANWQETGTQDVDLTAFLLGDNVAFVTAPGEMYDRYNSKVTWDQLKDLSQSEIYTLLSDTNEWNKILSSEVGGSYGTPFVMGYANSHIGYLPNQLAYEYCTGSAVAAVGAYEAHTTELNQGEGEQIMDIYAGMLKSMVSDELTESDLYNTAYCEACEATVNWKPISAEYNNDSGAPGLDGGHYYLAGDVSSSQKYVADGETVCIDLNGHTFTGETRAFYLDGGGDTLNIMDNAGGGVVQGYGSSNIGSNNPFGGGAVYVKAGDTCNFYSGTLTQAATETSGTAYGGVVEVATNGEFNMHGGTITGGKVHWTGLNGGTKAVPVYGGNVYITGGEFNMYDGTIKDGIAQAHVVQTTAEDGTVTVKDNVAYGGNVYVKAVAQTDADGNTYYTGSFNMYGGTVKDGQAISYTNENSETANSYGGNIYVNSNAHLNLYGGSITGGSAGYRGGCVYTASGYVTLSGSGSAGQIYAYSTDTTNVTVSGYYTGKAQIRTRNTTSSTAAGTVIGVSDNAVLNTTGLKAYGTNAALVVSGDSLVIGSTTTCGCCGETVVMNELTQALWDAYGGDLPTAHYRLAEDITAAVDANGVEMSNTVCIDLNGNTLRSTTGRLYDLQSGSTVRICDSSEAQTGSIVTAGLPSDTTTMYGGLFYVRSGATLELKSGTLTMEQGENMYVQRGGIVYVAGTFNMSGGTVAGGVCNQTDSSCYGGNIAITDGGVMNMSDGSISGGCAFSGNTAKEGSGGNIQVFKGGTLNMSGGTMDMGTAEAEKYGLCIRQSPSSKVVLSGDASPAEVSFRMGCLDISGTYTGTTVLRLASGTMSSGDVVGAAVDANIDNADITVYDSDLKLSVEGTDLVLSAPGVNIVDAQGVATPYGSLSQALDVYAGTDETLMLMGNCSEEVTISQNVVIDLNGCDLSGIALDTGVTLTVMDSQTDDYTVADDIFGKLSGVSAVAADGYVSYTHEDGTVSFHKVDTKVKTVNCRPSKAGIYYGSQFLGDEYVQAQVESFGVALSIDGAPMDESSFAEGSQYSAFTGSQFKAGNDSFYTSTVLVNILSEDYGTITNKRNGSTKVNGISYIKLVGSDSYILGNEVSWSLQDIIERTNINWDEPDENGDPKVPEATKQAVFAMYEKYPAVFKAWDTDTIISAYEAAKEEAEAKVLKVLVIGNSHSLDSTNLLYEVFDAEGLPEQYEGLVLGAMYHSGCQMSRHYTNISTNRADYTYYKNDGTSADGSWTLYDDTTLLTALQDEKWDVVLLQEMNVQQGITAEFQDNDIANVVNYVCQKLGYQPKLMWNMVWANPEIPSDTGYTYYTYTQEELEQWAASNGGEIDGSEDESYTGSSSSSTPWTYAKGKPGNLVRWEYNYNHYFNNDYNTMYQMMVANVQKYVDGQHGISDVIGSGTAVWYAINKLGLTEQDLYRDYTHLNDYSRVMVSYLWYAELCGLESIDQVSYTVVPAHLRQVKFQSEGDLDFSSDTAKIQAIIDAVNYTLENTYGEY